MTVNYNLDELTENRKMLATIGRSDLEQIIHMLLDERRDLLAALIPKKPRALEAVHETRHRDAADAYLYEGEKQLADDYHAIHDSFHGATTPPENPETD